MDPVEIRLLAVGGIVVVGVVTTTLVMAVGALVGWVGRIARRRRPLAVRAVGQPRDLGAGRIRC